jgi:hypothetical protein
MWNTRLRVPPYDQIMSSYFKEDVETRLLYRENLVNEPAEDSSVLEAHWGEGEA